MGLYQLKNPFVTTVYHGDKYFCDRQEELSGLVRNLENGSSTTLFSARRMGKTGLLHHTISHLPKDCKGVYVDIMATEDLNQFLNLLTTAIVKAIPERSNIGKKLWNFVKSMRPVIAFDTLSGEPQVTFDLDKEQVEYSISSVLQFLETQDYNTLIVIDEFQQITQYPEKKTEAWLRSQVQLLKRVLFIFSGSQEHLMSELFSSPERPFYRSTQMMRLGKIKDDVYRDFIIEKFREHKKEMPAEVCQEILDWCDTYTFYVQSVCNRVFSATTSAVTTELWKKQAEILLLEQEHLFYNYRNLLSNAQWQLLKAIAAEEKLYQPTGKDFIQKYKLGSSSIVLRSLEALIKYEMVLREYHEGGEGYYRVYDVFFQHWIKRKFVLNF